jgi:hypothetical protein
VSLCHFTVKVVAGVPTEVRDGIVAAYLDSIEAGSAEILRAIGIHGFVFDTNSYGDLLIGHEGDALDTAPDQA